MPKCDCKKHKHCLNCDKRLRFSAKTVNGYCVQCWKTASDIQRCDFSGSGDIYMLIRFTPTTKSIGMTHGKKVRSLF